MTAEEVKALYPGEHIRMIGTDAQGEDRSVICTVAFHCKPFSKFLTYRVKGQLRKCAIRDYPGIRYERYAE